MIPTYRRFDINDTPSATAIIYLRAERFGDPVVGATGRTALLIGLTSVDRTNSAINQVGATTQLTATVSVDAHTATNTILSNLLLARFQDATLEWTYTTPYMATTRIKFQELSDEYPPYLTTPLPEPAYLFVFNEVGVHVDTFTSYENTITVPTGALAGVFAPAPFSFATVKTGLKLDQEKIEIQSWKFDGNPLNKMWPFALDGILQVSIYEVDAANPTSATAITRFFGDVWSIDSQYKCTAIPFGNFFDRKFPRFLLQVSDNYTQFSPPTNLAASSFVVAGFVETFSIGGDSQAITVSGAVTSQADDYFAGGWLEVGSGATLERRGILHNSTTTLHIDRPLIKTTVAHTAVNFYPGYDGSIDQCDAKFSNRINFGGHAYIPNVSPAVKAIQPQNTQGGKKRG